MMYYEVVKSAFHGMLAAKDFYLLYQSAMGRDPNQALLRQFITVQTQLLNPITPHFSDFMWSGALKNREPVETTPWPELVPEDPVVLAQKSYLENLLRDIRLEHKERLRKSAKKSKQVAPVETQELKGVDVYVARSRPEWQQAAVDALRELVGSHIPTSMKRSLTIHLGHGNAQVDGHESAVQACIGTILCAPALKKQETDALRQAAQDPRRRGP